jgi:hypothetical protein
MTLGEIAAIAGVDERAVRQRVFLAMGGSPEAFEPRREGSHLRIDQYFREQSTQKEFDNGQSETHQRLTRRDT